MRRAWKPRSDKDVDVIHICTPNSLHMEVAKAALEAGKHVVCEKPLATSLQDARVLTELAKSKGLVGTVPFINRYHPMVREARSRVQSDETGKLYLIQGSYLQDWLMQAGDTNWRVDAGAGGKSRAFADIGSHLCDLIEWITGERFTSLIATLGTPIAQRSAAASRVAFQASGEVKDTKPVATEDVACLILRTDRGTLASLTISQVSAGRKNRLWFELDGAQQSVMFDLESPEQLWIGRREGMTMLCAIHHNSRPNSGASRCSLPATRKAGAIVSKRSYAIRTRRFVARSMSACRPSPTARAR